MSTFAAPAERQGSKKKVSRTGATAQRKNGSDGDVDWNKAILLFVPKLLLGNGVVEAPASRRTAKQEIPSLYISLAKPEKTVIPAGMPESRAMDGNVPILKIFDLDELPARSSTD